jgi:hypothetical protein
MRRSAWPINVFPRASYVAAAVLSTVFLLLGQTRAVGKARARSGVEYPRGASPRRVNDVLQA